MTMPTAETLSPMDKARQQYEHAVSRQAEITALSSRISALRQENHVAQQMKEALRRG